MATKLFTDIIVGPIVSRRLGISLGVNLLPTNGKLCNFNCVYCECGWTLKSSEKLQFNPKEIVLEQLENKLFDWKAKGETLDVITFAGNGEPTMHPDFAEIIDATMALRDKYFPNVKVAVLSNATLLDRESVRSALEKVDRAILKIDSAFDETIKLIDAPQGSYSLRKVMNAMKKFRGEIIIQTMFLRGSYEGQIIDNTTKVEVDAWLDVLDEINPSQVMIYTIDRDTPLETLSKVSYEEMCEIAERVKNLEIEVSVAK